MQARSHPRARRLLLGTAMLAAVGLTAQAGAILPPPDAPVTAAIADTTIDLCAKPGTVDLPGAAGVPIWGFVRKPTPTTPCSDVSAQLPGPTLEVATGDVVSLNVTNAIPGQTLTLAAPGISFDDGGADIASGDTASVTFTATDPGTYLYSSSGNAGRQQAMGLAGALLVCSSTPCPSAGTHYGAAYDRAAVLVLGEIDPAFNASPDSFDMRDWAPSYWLVNGKARPDTADITASPGEHVLLRYLSAGPETVTMTMLGLHARLVARDAFRLGDPFDVVAETVPAGATADLIAAVPPAAAPGAAFPVYNRQLQLNNGTYGAAQFAPTGGGGMMTFIRVPG
jgi:FtsP/CotA-like multicopper oxidase with cupredoxin domain